MKNLVSKVVITLFLLLCYTATALNLGGDGTSEQDAMVYYLLGESETYPNLKLKLWSEFDQYNETTFGE